MRAFVICSALATVVATATGCPNAFDCNGLSTDLPTIADGKGSATRSDGAAFNEDASWASGSGASVDIGVLDMIIAKDGSGTALDTLLGDGALPICVPQAERSDSSGSANLLEGNSFVSDASHTGAVAILGIENDFLIGRFAVDLVSSDGNSTVSFTDGVFKARRR